MRRLTAYDASVKNNLVDSLDIKSISGSLKFKLDSKNIVDSKEVKIMASGEFN